MDKYTIFSEGITDNPCITISKSVNLDGIFYTDNLKE
jgi:hypothetical protein